MMIAKMSQWGRFSLIFFKKSQGITMFMLK